MFLTLASLLGLFLNAAAVNEKTVELHIGVIHAKMDNLYYSKEVLHHYTKLTQEGKQPVDVLVLAAFDGHEQMCTTLKGMDEWACQYQGLSDSFLKEDLTGLAKLMITGRTQTVCVCGNSQRDVEITALSPLEIYCNEVSEIEDKKDPHPFGTRNACLATKVSARVKGQPFDFQLGSIYISEHEQRRKKMVKKAAEYWKKYERTCLPTIVYGDLASKLLVTNSVYKKDTDMVSKMESVWKTTGDNCLEPDGKNTEHKLIDIGDLSNKMGDPETRQLTFRAMFPYEEMKTPRHGCIYKASGDTCEPSVYEDLEQIFLWMTDWWKWNKSVDIPMFSSKRLCKNCKPSPLKEGDIPDPALNMVATLIRTDKKDSTGVEEAVGAYTGFDEVRVGTPCKNRNDVIVNDRTTNLGWGDKVGLRDASGESPQCSGKLQFLSFDTLGEVQLHEHVPVLSKMKLSMNVAVKTPFATQNVSTLTITFNVVTCLILFFCFMPLRLNCKQQGALHEEHLLLADDI